MRRILTIDKVKTVLERTGGNRVEAALELQVARGTLHSFIAQHHEIIEFLAEIEDDARQVDILARRLRRGDVEPEHRREIRSLLSRCLHSEARAA